VSIAIKGGDRLLAGLAAAQAALRTANAVSVGFFETSTYPAKARQGVTKRRAGPADSGGPLYVAQVAFWNEYGTTRAPPRPFFRTMIARKSAGWGVALGKALKGRNFDASGALAVLGEAVNDQLVQSIVQWPADNAPYTVKRKGFNKGLIETGLMQRSTGYVVT
jgi:hypothetical protein